MSEVRTRVEESIHIDAAPGAVFAYCLEPTQLFAGDPKKVVEHETRPGGLGTTARLQYHMGAMHEDDRLE